MRSWRIWLLPIVFCVGAWLGLGAGSASAAVPYPTYTLDSQGQFVYTQTSYVPVGVIDGSNIPGNPGFSSPNDLAVHGHYMYIADTLNARVVVLNLSGKFVRFIGQGVLNQPTGLFVDSAGHVYVADGGNEAVYKFNPTGKLIQTFLKPTSPLFGNGTPFSPQKVVVDSQGDLFIVDSGSIQGLVELSPQGIFEGYFGGNRANFNLTRYLERLFYTNVQLSQLQALLPSSITNVAIGPNGLVYTVTAGLSSEVIKRLNVAGDNLLPTTMHVSQNIASVTIDPNGDIYAVNTVSGEITEYDRDGNLLSAFAGSDVGNERLGLLKSPAAIAVDSRSDVYVLDKESNNIQVYEPTEYTQLVHQALRYYLDGRYIASIKPWTEVLRLNSMFDLAHDGIGMADLRQGNYAQALSEFQVSGDRQGYSNAYWELRRVWLLTNTSTVILALVSIMVLWSLTKLLYRKMGFGRPLVLLWQRIRRYKPVAQLFHVFRLFRHPIDGFYELKVEGKASAGSALLLLIIYFLVNVFVVYQTNFLFTSTDLATVNLAVEFYQTLIPVLAWIISNYLVSAVQDGEGRFRDVFMGTVYSLGPYIVFAAPLAILSRGLTVDESVPYTMIQNGIWIWTALLMFIMVKEIHGYEFRETVRSIFLTLVGMVIMVILAFILFGLSNQVFDFAHSVIEEVILRVQGQ